jgi:hypothetical protein
MSRTFKDIKTKYLTEAEQQQRNQHDTCSGCNWCAPARNRVRSSEKKNAISFELNLIELDELSAELQQAINNYINN